MKDSASDKEVIITFNGVFVRMPIANLPATIRMWIANGGIEELRFKAIDYNTKPRSE
jgi:hypothetical protein